MAEISIIIPVYNGAEFVRPCYESLKSQSFQDWEAVFVNDGSKDNSQEVLEQLSKEDSRVTVLTKVNEGVAKAREDGVRIANGDFVTFLDVDDYFSNDALQEFVIGLRNGADIVAGGVTLVNEEKHPVRLIAYANEYVDNKKAFSRTCRGELTWQLWGKAYRKDLFKKGIESAKGIRIGEDMAVYMQLLANSDRMYLTNRILYYYLQNSASVTHKKKEEDRTEAAKAVLWVRDILERKPGVKSNMLDAMCMLNANVCLVMGADPGNEYLQRIRKECFSWSELRHIHPLKAVNLAVYKLFGINLTNVLKRKG